MTNHTDHAATGQHKSAAFDLAQDDMGFERRTAEREMLLTDSCATAKAAAARDARTCRDCGTGFDACVCHTGEVGDPFRKAVSQ